MLLAPCSQPSRRSCAITLTRDSYSTFHCLLPSTAHSGVEFHRGRKQRHGNNAAAPSPFVSKCRYARGPTPPSSNKGGGGGRLPGNTQPQGQPPRHHISPPGLGQFRPPPSAYVPEYQESEEEKNAAASRKKLLVEKLREGQGLWQERAAFIKELQQLGVTSEDLYGLTFVPIFKQLEFVVAAQVYDSLVHCATSPEVLRCFDEFSTNLLYALRTLSARQRRSAAEYVIENSLGVEEAQKLAWAIKDHERRPLGRQGFTTAPGDCLAFMYHRQAIETQEKEHRTNVVDRGLRVAVTDSARQRFSEFS